ncbi:MAG: DUF4105 domain-containing protein [Tepidisphaeraceae bacterium]
MQQVPEHFPSTKPVTQAHEPTSPSPAPRRPVRRLIRALGRLILWLVVLALSGWAVLAIYFADLSAAPPRTVRAALFAVAVVASIVLIRPRKYALATVAVLVAAVLAWYFSIPASNDRDWSADNARTARVVFDGDKIIVHNVRDCDWRSDSDFTPRWEDRTYRLSQLRSVDVTFCHWGSKAIAHLIVSFGFADGQYLCVSIETRKERVEHEVPMLQTAFRNYELIYVFADERDSIRVRTNCRNQNLYMFRTNLTPNEAEVLFRSYATRANELAEHPAFYNALTSNCVTNVVHLSRVIHPTARISWDMLLSGYAPRRGYRNGRLDTRIPFEELEARSLIDKAAQAADKDPNFSAAIRADLPVPQPHLPK